MQLLTAFTENEEIYPFFWSMLQTRNSKNRREGGQKGLEVWSVQLDPDKPPWIAL